MNLTWVLKAVWQLYMFLVHTSLLDNYFIPFQRSSISFFLFYSLINLLSIGNSYVFLCSQLPQYLASWNNKYYLTKFLVGYSGSGSFMRLQSSCWPRLQSLKTWLGLEDPPSSLRPSLLAEILIPSQGSMVPAFSRGRERGRQREVGGRKTKNALKGSCSVFL